MKNRVRELLADHEERHSDFQINYFIVGCAGDQWAQYKQALRELQTRYDILRDKYAKAKSMRRELAALKKANQKKINRMKYRELLSLYKKSLSEIKSTFAEFKKVFSLADSLKEKIGAVDDDQRWDLETESWKNKGTKMAAIDILATGRISNQTYDFVFSLPKDSQLELFAKLSTSQPMELLGFEPDEIRSITRK